MSTSTDVGVNGCTVIVTGACSGIGVEYVRAFAAAGANVIGMDLADAVRTSDVATQDVKRNPIFVSGDVTSDAAWATVVDRAMAEYGRLDVLVNNAAIYREIETKRPLTELGVDEWDRVLTVNVRGTWQGIKAVAPVMADGGGGRIVNVSSVVAWTSPPGFAHYVASKAAVNGLTRAAARELGPAGIRVNAVAPGLVDNEASRALNNDEYLDAAAGARALARPMVPVDIVGAVLWLASENAGFVTGQTIVVDGGQVML